jgi:hypothetical protein
MFMSTVQVHGIGATRSWRGCCSFKTTAVTCRSFCPYINHSTRAMAAFDMSRGCPWFPDDTDVGYKPCFPKTIGVVSLLIAVAAFDPVIRAPAAEKSGWIKLFNGKDLSGWHAFLDPRSKLDPDKIWMVKDGCIFCEGSDLHGVDCLPFVSESADGITLGSHPFGIAAGGHRVGVIPGDHVAKGIEHLNGDGRESDARGRANRLCAETEPGRRSRDQAQRTRNKNRARSRRCSMR